MSIPSPLSHIVLTGAEGTKQRLMSWQAALSLSLNCRNADIKITHICPEHCETDTDDGVILSPVAIQLLKTCGITETQLLSQCDGAYHCAERYIGWSSEEQDFYYTYGAIGVNLKGIEFQHYLTRYRQKNQLSLTEYSLTAQCAQLERFTQPVSDPRSVLSTLNYRIVVSAIKYTELLRKLALQLGVIEQLGKVGSVELFSSQLQNYDPVKHGFINSLLLDSGQSISADFFIDCGGCLASLMYDIEDFGCRKLNLAAAANRVIAGSTDKNVKPSLASVSQALPNCHYKVTTTGTRKFLEVHYNHSQLTDSEVLESVSEQINLADFSFTSSAAITTSICYQPWSRNCLLVGTKACQVGQKIGDELTTLLNDLARFYSLFPNTECNRQLTRYYNSKAVDNYQQLVDWQQLAYKQAGWRKQPFWQQNSAGQLSEQLNRICTLFGQTGCFPVYEQQTYTKAQWIHYLLGFELWPENYDPLLSGAEEQQIAQFLSKLSSKIKSLMPSIPVYQQSSHL